LIDWTWFVPGNACVALLCAGWLAGRGPLHALSVPVAPATGPLAQAPAPAGPFSAMALGLRACGATVGARLRAAAPMRRLVAGTVVVLSLLAGWSEWQPLRSASAADHALTALGRHDLPTARSEALRAGRLNPLSVQPLFDLAAVQLSSGDKLGARATLQRAVRLQPATPQTWIWLSDFDATALNNPRQALTELRPALYLDPRSFQVITQFLALLRQLGGTAAPAQPGQPLPAVQVPRGPATGLAPTTAGAR
jgi:hypothetical protein